MIPFNYHHLYYFYTISREASVSKAASVLRLAQPTLSAQLKQFEDFLGFRLFERDNRRLTLTEEGKRILAYAQDIFNLGRELMDRLNDRSLQGKLKIQIGTSAHIPKAFSHALIRFFLKSRQDLYMDLKEGSEESLKEGLRSHSLDLVLSDMPFLETSDSSFQSQLIQKIPIVFCAGRRLAKRHRSILEFLKQTPIIMPTSDSQVYQAIQEYFIVRKIKPNILGEIQDIEVVRRMVLDNLGIAPLNIYTVLTAPAHEGMVQLGKPQDYKIEEPVYLVTAKRKYPHPAVEQAIREFRLHIPAY